MRKFIYLLIVICILAFAVPASLLAEGTNDLTNLNKERCQKWCAAHKLNCDFCSDQKFCGPGYERIAGFGDIDGSWSKSGKHWYACFGGQDDRKNQQACENWCNANKPSCVKCSPKTGCGQGYKALTTFGGKGKNWHACEKTDFKAHSDELKEKCLRWCEANKSRGCAFCDTKYYCGVGAEPMQHFTGRGKNWHACRYK